VPPRAVSWLGGIWTGGGLLTLGVKAGPILDPGVEAANVPVAGDAADGVGMGPAALAFASFLSSFRLFLSSLAWADSSTSVFIFH
jgi:hypothetical protein